MSINTMNTVPDAFSPLVKMAEHFDQFYITDWETTKYTSSLFMDFPMESFPLFKGPQQKSNIWRQGLSHVMGLSDWEDIPDSRAPGTTGADDPGLCACDEYTPKILNNGGQETWTNEIKRLLLASPAICVNDLRQTDEAPRQIEVRVQFFMNQIKEYAVAYRREQAIRAIVRANHGYLMNDASFSPSLSATDNHWYYDPDTLYDGVPCLHYKAGDEVGTLNIEQLVQQTRWLSAQCPDAATGSMDGAPTFTWYGDSQDLENMIRSDSAAREDVRYAEPGLLMGSWRKFRTYRGITIAPDLSQMRFTEIGVVAGGGTLIPDGRGGYLGAGNWIRCARVSPERESDRVGLNGFKIVEANPEYFRAPLRLLPAIMNNLMAIQVGSKLEKIGGMVFGPQPGYNGEVKFLVYPENAQNPFGEKGAFFSRYELGIRPMKNYPNAVGYLYRSCQQMALGLCSTDGTATVATALATAAVEADVDTTNKTVTVTLATTIAATNGTQVDVKDKDGTADGVGVYVLDATLAPTYVLGFSSLDAFGLSSPSAAEVAAELTTDATVQVV